jgi:hypothetical protein
MTDFETTAADVAKKTEALAVANSNVKALEVASADALRFDQETTLRSAALATSIASGKKLNVGEVSAAAAERRDSEHRIGLITSAMAIAVATVADREKELRAATHTHAQWAIRAAMKVRAASCRKLAEGARSFADDLLETQAAGQELERIILEARSASGRQFFGITPGFDDSKIAVRRLAAVLPSWLLGAIVSNQVTTNVDFDLIAKQEDDAANGPNAV